MIFLRSWTEVGEAATAITPAGPLISRAAADAAVIRLRRAGEWAMSRLARATPLAKAAEAAAAVPFKVVDRHGLLRALAASVAGDAGDPTPSPSVPLAVGVTFTLSKLARSVQTTRSDSGMLLVAPNVWTTASRLRLDQGDYAKWVALRAGLWGVCFAEAPWLAAHLRHLAMASPRGVAQLAQISVLLSQLVLAQMEHLTPQDVPSVGWIRAHVPESNLVQTVSLLRHSGDVNPDIMGLEAAAHAFVHELHLHEDPVALRALLSSADHLPTAEELGSPPEWAARVGLG